MADTVAFVGSHGVSGLERLATAVYLVSRSAREADKQLVSQLREVKPHVSASAGDDAIQRARGFLDVGEPCA
jgi:hypothetical protein